MGETTDWKPTADFATLIKRAELYKTIREYMSANAVLEVDTPILSHSGISDPYIESVKANSRNYTSDLYLQTSPEFCMKRLLAAGCGSIYQIAHVFRDEEQGRHHATEFSMLEWYRLNMNYHELMDDVIALMQVLGLTVPVKLSYAEAFDQVLRINPHDGDLPALRSRASKFGLASENLDKNQLLDFLFSSVVIKQINAAKNLIIYDYPAEMAALASIRHDDYAIAERFELFVNGLEIANGYNELTDVDEQRERFTRDLNLREKNHADLLPIDEYFLSALDSGLPICSGVAVGLDRLLMVLMNKERIEDVMSFTLVNN